MIRSSPESPDDRLLSSGLSLSCLFSYQQTPLPKRIGTVYWAGVVIRDLSHCNAKKLLGFIIYRIIWFIIPEILSHISRLAFISEGGIPHGNLPFEMAGNPQKRGLMPTLCRTIGRGHSATRTIIHQYMTVAMSGRFGSDFEISDFRTIPPRIMIAGIRKQFSGIFAIANGHKVFRG